MPVPPTTMQQAWVRNPAVPGPGSLGMRPESEAVTQVLECMQGWRWQFCDATMPPVTPTPHANQKVPAQPQGIAQMELG